MNYNLFTVVSSPNKDLHRHPLYPHDFDDLVFIVYQRGKFKQTVPHSSLTSIAQWFLIIFVVSILLYALRRINKWQRRRLTHSVNRIEAPEYFLFSFIDSLAVFLGTSLHRFGNSRAERWFLVSFAIFGLIFKCIFTDNLFIMYTTKNLDRITTIDQLFEANIPITVESAVVHKALYGRWEIRTKSYVIYQFQWI